MRKTPFTSAFVLIALSAGLFACSGGKGPANADTVQTVTISGIVTDFDGNPIDNSVVRLKHADFSEAYETFTDEDGYYSLEVEKGRYASMYVLRLEEYPRNNAVPLEDMRLEFWAWNVIADRDLTINPRYHKLELYGTTVFGTIGGYKGLFVYFRPMSVGMYTALSEDVFTDKEAAGRVADISVRPENLSVDVYADGEQLKVNSITPVEEYLGEGNVTITDYLVQVDAPSKQPDKPYIVFRIEAENTEFGEKGENIYFYEVPEYM